MQVQHHVEAPSISFPGHPRPPLSSSDRDILEWPQCLRFFFLGVHCGLSRCLRSSFRFLFFFFFQWASEGFFLQRQSPVGWGIGLGVELMAGTLSLTRGSSCSLCLSCFCVFCLCLPGCFRVLAERLPAYTRTLGWGRWCSKFHQSLNYVLQGPQRNLYPHKRASLSQQIQLSGI